jgi:hypothetical protein
MVLKLIPAFAAFHFGPFVRRLTRRNRSNFHAGARILELLNPVPVHSLLLEQALAYFKVRKTFMLYGELF